MGENDNEREAKEFVEKYFNNISSGRDNNIPVRKKKKVIKTNKIWVITENTFYLSMFFFIFQYLLCYIGRCIIEIKIIYNIIYNGAI